MLQNFIAVLIASFAFHKQAVSQSLPVVDLGYSLHQASSFNVHFNAVCRRDTFADNFPRHPGERTISPTFGMQNHL